MLRTDIQIPLLEDFKKKFSVEKSQLSNANYQISNIEPSTSMDSKAFAKVTNDSHSISVKVIVFFASLFNSLL